MAKGGITKGKSHKEGGIPMVVKSTGQKVELEGGEGVINKKSMSDKTLHTFDGKKLTKCEIVSKINSFNNYGVTIDCDDTISKSKFEDGGMVTPYEEIIIYDYNDYFDDYRRNLDCDRKSQKIKRLKEGGKIDTEYGEPVKIRFKENSIIDYFDENENYDGSYKYLKGQIINANYILDSNLGKESYSFFNTPKDQYFDTFTYMIPKKSYEIVQDNFEIGGYVDFAEKNEGQYVDGEIMELLSRKDPSDLSIDEIMFLENFYGGNLANIVPDVLIEKAFGLLLKENSSSNPFKNCFIVNNGVGKILSIAPPQLNYLVSKSYSDNFKDEELIINQVLNQNKKNWQSGDYTDERNADCIFSVYPKINPEIDILDPLLRTMNKADCVGLAIAEFSDGEKLEIFSEKINTKSLVKVNKGFSENGEKTLIYIV